VTVDLLKEWMTRCYGPGAKTLVAKLDAGADGEEVGRVRREDGKNVIDEECR